MAFSAQTPAQRPATLEDFLAIPAHQRFHEIIDGELVQKALPSARHGSSQSRLSTLLGAAYDDSLGGKPGGWVLMTEVEVLLPGRQPVRPDLAGWRVERMPALPDEFPVKLRPDWVCEVVSPSDPARDTVIKYRDYARAGIPHYWLVDPNAHTVTSLLLQNEHYAIQAEAKSGEVFVAQPFELVAISLEMLFRSQSRERKHD